ncbi:MAG: diguanylate cyclase [Moraxellaceae bacterium]|nr:diguanylate cyclase [Moraxellaceae bacterium]
MNQWRQRLTSILEWSETDKGMIPVIFLIPTYLQYLAWGHYALGRPDRDQLINVPVMIELISMEKWMAAGAVALLLLGLGIRRKVPSFLPYQYLTTLYFAVTLAISSHYIGSMEIAAGVVLLGAVVFGFIFLKRGVVWLSFTVAMLLMLIQSYLSALGTLTYAPVMVSPSDTSSNLFWVTSNWLFASPFLVIIVLLADHMLNWWRQRENTIRIMSLTDALTGINNRRSIIDMLEKEIARTHRHGPPLCTVLLDLDHFKHVNDTWGHPMGDRVLNETATVLQQTVRQCDAVGRYGGEEFMLLLPDTTLQGAEALVERCRARLASMEITSDSGERIPISGSFGMVCNQYFLAASTEALIKEADDALYQAKEGGRNRVIAVNLMPPTK